MANSEKLCAPRPRIALFDETGEFAGVEAHGDLGRVVRGIAADADGGCFAAGYASAGKDLRRPGTAGAAGSIVLQR